MTATHDIFDEASTIRSALVVASGSEEATVRAVRTVLRLAGMQKVQLLNDSVIPLNLKTVPDVMVIVSGRSAAERDALITFWRKQLVDLKIVVVAPVGSRAGVRGALEIGAHGIVFANDLKRALSPTISAVWSGQVVVPNRYRLDIDPPTLSGREKQIIGMVVMGLSNKEIAQQLYVSQSTVKCHLSSVFRKLGVGSRHEAVAAILDPDRHLGVGILSISDAQRPRVEIDA